ncbi:hypothetical protein F5Y17DRAFT_401752 [Xylariaceae sp. FL0594]|nr:hypothetical protein F5Y17DRAFT_401752 [Xylariaceae sp. FL0594]
MSAGRSDEPGDPDHTSELANMAGCSQSGHGQVMSRETRPELEGGPPYGEDESRSYRNMGTMSFSDNSPPTLPGEYNSTAPAAAMTASAPFQMSHHHRPRPQSWIGESHRTTPDKDVYGVAFTTPSERRALLLARGGIMPIPLSREEEARRQAQGRHLLLPPMMDDGRQGAPTNSMVTHWIASNPWGGSCLLDLITRTRQVD